AQPRGNVAQNRIDDADGTLDTLQQHLTAGCQKEPVRLALEEWPSRITLELLDSLGHRRLGKVPSFRGHRQRLELCHGREQPEMSQVAAHHSLSSTASLRDARSSSPGDRPRSETAFCHLTVPLLIQSGSPKARRVTHTSSTSAARLAPWTIIRSRL